MKNTFQNQITGALLGLAIGDALGAPAEFHDQKYVQAQWGTLTEMVGGGPWNPGEWTDDCGMALCMAQGILANPQSPVDEIGTRFLEWRKTAKDVGSTIGAALSAYRGNWPQAAQNTPQARQGKAAGNGSLMRTLPVALAYGADREQMVTMAARLSAMTHWDGQAEMGCLVYCLWVENLLQGQPLREAWYQALREGQAQADRGPLGSETPGAKNLPASFWARLQAVESLRYEDLQPSGYAGYVVECLEAAAWCCLHTASLEEALVKAVNLAGEADTIAAVAGGVAGAYYGAEAIPQRWLDALYQRAELDAIAVKLAALRRHQQVYATQGLPAFNADWVTERILAGRNPLTAHDVEQLRALGITHILDLREPKEWALPHFGAEAMEAMEANGLQRSNLEVRDTGTPSAVVLDAACQWMEEALENPQHRVYVHCRAGLERTAAILIAYYASHHGVSYAEALAHLQKGRPLLAPLAGQERAVQTWLSNH